VSYSLIQIGSKTAEKNSAQTNRQTKQTYRHYENNGHLAVNQFSEKSWSKSGVNKLLKKLRDTGTVDGRPVSSRPRSAGTEESVETVNDLVLSEEDKMQTHRTVREISWETGIHQSSVFRIICKDLRLKCFKRRRAQELTDANCAALMKRAISFCFRLCIF